MTRLFRRRAMLQAGDVAIEAGAGDALRVKFAVRKTTSTEDPNTCEVTLSNLSSDTRARIEAAATVKPAQALILEAGYVDAAGMLFTGELVWAESVRERTGWTTTLRAASGRRAGEAYLSQALAAGQTKKQQVEAILRTIQQQDPLLSLKQARDRLEKKDYKGAVESIVSGVSMLGPAMKELDRVARQIGLEAWIDDGELVLLKTDEALLREAVVLTPSTGLIGAPIRAADDKEAASTAPPGNAQFRRPARTVVRGRSMLNPLITLGRRIDLESESTSGAFKVREVQHTGDTHGAEWFTEWEGAPIEGVARVSTPSLPRTVRLAEA